MEDSASSNTSRSDPALSWPPPGMSESQGAAWRMLALAGLGGGLLAFPLLWAIAREQPFWSLGPFGRPWWILPLASLLGLVILGSFFWRLFLLLRASAKASDRGYGLGTIARVAADGRRDTGFLLQGLRYYEGLEPDTRRSLLKLRVLAVGLYLLGALWIPLGCALGLLLAARGVLSTSAVWMLTLGPAGVLLLGGTICRGAEESTVRKARNRWFSSRASEEELEAEVDRWNRDLEDRLPPEALGTGARGTRSFRLARIVVIVLAGLVAIPALTLAFAGVVGPLLATISMPLGLRSQERLAEARAVARYEAAEDPEVSATQAGQVLNNLLHVGHALPGEGMALPPEFHFPEPWFPQPPPGVNVPVEPAGWSADLIAGWDELSPEERAYAETVARHPAQGQIRVLGQASELDVVGTRWRTPFPDTLTVASLPLPRVGALRTAASAAVTRAAWLHGSGRTAEAEETIRLLISAGLLLAEESPILMDNHTGMAMARVGGDALAALYVATGREDEGEAIFWIREAAREAARVVREASGTPSVETRFRALPGLVLDPQTVRGYRWETLYLVNTLAGCMNPHTAVFGPGESYEEWLERARGRLVEYPSEEALFDLARDGRLGAGGEPGPLGRAFRGIFGLTLGGSGTSVSCSTLFTAVR